MKDNSQNKNYYVMLLTICGGIFFIFYNIFFCKVMHPLIIIYSFLPFLIILIRSIIERNTYSVFFKAFSPLLAVVVIIMFLSSFVFVYIQERNTEVTSYLSYNDVLEFENYDENPYISHFLSEIPDYGIGVDFLEWNKSKDVMGMYLSYRLPGEYINIPETSDYITDSQIVIHNYYEYISTKRVYSVPDKVAAQMGIYGQGEIANDFIIYILGASYTNRSDYKYSYGVGINYDKKQVMYFCEKW